MVVGLQKKLTFCGKLSSRMLTRSRFHRYLKKNSESPIKDLNNEKKRWRFKPLIRFWPTWETPPRWPKNATKWHLEPQWDMMIATSTPRESRHWYPYVVESPVEVLFDNTRRSSLYDWMDAEGFKPLCPESFMCLGKRSASPILTLKRPSGRFL